MTLLNVKEYKYPTENMPWFKSIPIDRDNLLLPEFVIENYDFEPEDLFKYYFDSLWNACGISKSPNYDKEGKRKSN